MSQGGDINVGSITWRDLAKNKEQLEGIITSAMKNGEEQGVVLQPEEWEAIIKRKLQNAVKLNKQRQGGTTGRQQMPPLVEDEDAREAT